MPWTLAEERGFATDHRSVLSHQVPVLHKQASDVLRSTFMCAGGGAELEPHTCLGTQYAK